LEVIRHLVAHGCGVGILPTRVAKPDIYPTLHVFQENTPIYKDKVALIYRVDRQTSFAANTIIQSIKQSFD
jgi:DNA-binding transcriptional LysR family regulator